MLAEGSKASTNRTLEMVLMRSVFDRLFRLWLGHQVTACAFIASWTVLSIASSALWHCGCFLSTYYFKIPSTFKWEYICHTLTNENICAIYPLHQMSIIIPAHLMPYCVKWEYMCYMSFASNVNNCANIPVHLMLAEDSKASTNRTLKMVLMYGLRYWLLVILSQSELSLSLSLSYYSLCFLISVGAFCQRFTSKFCLRSDENIYAILRQMRIYVLNILTAFMWIKSNLTYFYSNSPSYIEHLRTRLVVILL